MNAIDELLKQLETDPEHGLSGREVNERHRNGGYNEFAKTEHTSLFVKFISQFKSFMIIVLLLAAIISGIAGYMNGEGITDALIILAILIVNAIIGVFQEDKAEKSLDALEKLSAPHCKVIRDGKMQVVESRDLVVGDIVAIETGDNVPADLRLIESVNLKIQEAALTGESMPAEKDAEASVPEDAPLGDRVNMAYSSSDVTYGHGRGVVTAIGVQTEVGKIAAMLQSVTDVKTPLQMKLDQLGKVFSIICLVICGVMMAIGLYYGRNLMDMFMTAVSMAVAAIPEGLPAVSTVVLALGVQRLAKRNAIVRNLPSVETLGGATVICSDKTGTLTQNKMSVTEIFNNNEQLIETAVLANDAVINDGVAIGDPTETALIDMGLKNGIDKDRLEHEMPRVAEIPFDSDRKLMTTIHKEKDGSYLVAVKGGLDELLACCTRIRDGKGVRKIERQDIERIGRRNEELASKAMRVLAMARKGISELPHAISPSTIENELVFLGMVGMIDPPRDEAKDAVAQCKAAGIKPVMITGDHKTTATAIARELGIASDKDNILTGQDVQRMDEGQLVAAARSASVFARVAPEHKVRIVKAFQSMGNVVAMTGDGVNDAPALKLADIGVAMGISGTDVAKEAADVVLTDDNFSTIVSSVREGRRIYDNLMKSICFMISTNIAEIIFLLSAVLLDWDMPLLPIQLLFINLVGDSMPALAIGVDQAESDIMNRMPIKPGQSIFTKRFTFDVMVRAIIISAMTIAAFLLGQRTSLDAGRTMGFAVMIFSQFTMIFSIRNAKRWFGHRLFTNRWLWGSIALALVLTLIVMILPWFQEMFRLAPLTLSQWLWVAGLSLSTLLIAEVYKSLRP